MDAKKILTVTNRSASEVIYRIPEMNIRREFRPGESKRIEYQELEKLTFRPGGLELLTNYLQVLDPAVTNELNIHTEVEYNMNKEQVIKLLQEGSLDAFLDCLDFAPKGVIDLIKDCAVKLPLMDLYKRDALLQKTGFDITKVLKHLEEEKLEEKQNSNANNSGKAVTGRRVPVGEKVAQSAPATQTRRVSPSKYNVVARTGAPV